MSKSKIRIFVGYSRKDKKWRAKLDSHLKSVSRHPSVEYFTDSDIKAGERWDNTLENRLSGAHVIILLVSADFFASDYIIHRELPLAMKRIESDDALLLRIQVGECVVPDHVSLDKFHAVHDIKKPLNGLSESEVDAVFTATATRVNEVVKKSSSETSPKSKKKSGEEKDNKKIGKRKIASKKKPSRKSAGVTSKISGEVLSQKDVAYYMDENMFKLEALRLWAKNTFDEWVYHDSAIQTNEVRIKSTQSVYNKVKKMQADGKVIRSFEDVKEKMFDLVAARVLVNTVSTVESMHLQIVGHPRFKVFGMVVHYFEEAPNPTITRILELADSEVDFAVERKPNITGYTGVHYWIGPKPVDGIYVPNSESCLHNKLELQVRTVIQHAWSELQHQEVYKNIDDSKKRIAEAKFAVLASQINSADGILDSLKTRTKITESRDFDTNYSENVQLFVDLGRSLEKNNSPEYNRYEMASKFAKEHASLIEHVLDNGSYNDQLEIALFYLRGTLYDEARELYENLVHKRYRNEASYNWTIIRYVEACRELSDEKEVRRALKLLGARLLENKDAKLDPDDVRLYISGSVNAWRIGDFELAVSLGDSADRFASMDNPREKIKTLSNLLYFKTEYLRQQYLDDDEFDKYDLIEELDNLVKVEDEINSILEENSLELLPSQLDSFVWFHFVRAREARSIMLDEEVSEILELAENYLHQKEILVEQQGLTEKSIWISTADRVKKLRKRLDTRMQNGKDS